MARRETPRRYTFNENARYVVRKPFKVNGRAYAIGDEFCKVTVAVSTRQLWQLYGAGYITGPEGATTEAGVAVPGTGVPEGVPVAAPVDAPDAPDAPVAGLERLDLTPEELKAMEEVLDMSANLDPDQLDQLSFADLKTMADGMGLPRRNSKAAQIATLLGEDDA
jgi:hypothetical protein